MPLLILGGLLLLPLAEIAVFILVGKAIGVLPTILLTVLTAVAGTVLLRQQGLSLVRRMQSELDAGRVPGDDMMQGAMIVLASLFLLLPGFLTDAVGLLLFIPPLRVALARFFSRRASVVVVNRRRKQGEPVVDLDGAEWTSTRHKPDDDGAPRISPWRDGN
ncbi:FxsA family protein [Pannonibacter phragmitetus]|uniref:FxsA family protein n=1 Tax=Pannonibacter phragmitetus TaxID=121719 RepID=UPI0003825C24|nr:FxsA family protein [Pannonibacter phragmitetus]